MPRTSRERVHPAGAAATASGIEPDWDVGSQWLKRISSSAPSTAAAHTAKHA